MKKILCTFLLSAMLVLVLGGCESEEKIAASSQQPWPQGLQAEFLANQPNLQLSPLELQVRVERLSRQVGALTAEVIWLHNCAKRELDHTYFFESLWLHGSCAGGYPKYGSTEDYRSWKEKGYWWAGDGGFGDGGGYYKNEFVKK